MSSEPRRRQNLACLTCKRRKVRCNAATVDLPCTPCQRGGLECSPSDKEGARRPAAARQRAARPSTLTQHSGPIDGTLLEEDAPTPVPASERSSGHSKEPEINTSLSTFLEQGITNAEWKLFSGSNPLRLAYIGTAFGNLATLVRNEQPAIATILFPFPAIKQPLPWKPKPGVLPFTVSDDLLRDIGSVPAREVRDALIDAYFRHIHPNFPCISEPLFRRQYADPRNPPPLILLQAVLLAGAHVSDHPLVAADRSTVKITLYRRTRELFHLRYENDRLYLVQAALLMTWHQENADEVSCNAWSWAGKATRIAFGLGAHRELSPHVPLPMPAWDRRRYRFTWWTLFHTETFAALHFGRPCSIRWEDFDVSDLIPDDYRDPDDNADTTIRRDCFELNIALSYIAQDCMKLFAPRAPSLPEGSSVSLSSRLASLAMNLPLGDDGFSCQARLNYHLVVLHCHRTNRHEYGSEQKQDEALKVRSEAASAMLAILELMAAKDCIRQCHFTCNTALMAVVVQFIEDVKLAIHANSIILASSAHAKLGRVIGPGREIARSWPNAEAVLKMCQNQHEKFGTIILAYVNEPSPHVSMPIGETDDVFLQDIFSAYDNLDFSQEMPDYGWMNTTRSG